ncbi:hypothetical protein [Photobacterium toruni]|uniref:Uncharacterized protein n=1 Tax=Photobacterium toruni TaxID=1935446 RepID=A0A1T4UJ09_9GAMM|nr:hypothetical protein [Photobacterium toruni]SKA52663.1 hypothetical protein CZ814_03321 [Photobacterium toruni]
MCPPKHYRDLATEAQVEQSKHESQVGMVSSLEFEQYKQYLQTASIELTKIFNESAGRLTTKGMIKVNDNE